MFVIRRIIEKLGRNFTLYHTETSTRYRNAISEENTVSARNGERESRNLLVSS